MITQQEKMFIKKFVIKSKQDRYLMFLANDKTRGKFTQELYHFNDFDWKLFREISGNEMEQDIITAALAGKKYVSTCFVISADVEHDGKFMPVNEAIRQVLGVEGTIMIFGDAEIIYYEGEAPKRRYISI